MGVSSEERRVVNVHRNLGRYLDLPESERMSDGTADRTRPNYLAQTSRNQAEAN